MSYSSHSALPEVNNQQPIPYQTIFEAQAGLVLLLSPDFIIQGATDSYLRETFVVRAEVTGKSMFDVFPDNPDVPEAAATRNLRASLQQVLATGKPHKMDVQHYDAPDPENPGKFVERYWSVINTPAFGPDGKVICIIHEAVNITDSIKAQQIAIKSREREESALAHAEQQRLRLERLFDQAPAAIAILEGPEFIYRVLNKSYEELFPGRKLQGLPLFEALPELRDQAVYDIIHKVYQTGETFEGKEVFVPVARFHDQPVQDFYWNFIYQALFDQQGNVNGILIFSLDVTEFVKARKQIEKNAEYLQALNMDLEDRVSRRTNDLQLAEARADRQSARLESLFMQAPSAICILDGPDLVYELVNPGYAKLFPERELLGKPILEVLPEIKENKVYKTFRQVYETGITHEESELLIPFARLEDGVLEDRYFRYILQARYNENQQVDGVIVFAIEVTEQVEARKAVEASVRQLRLVTDSLPVLIGYLDKEERYRFTNKAYEKWFPIKAEDLLGRAVRDVVGEQAYNNTKGYIDRALAGQRVDFEAMMPYREGFTKHIRTSYVPDIRDGEIHGFYTLVTDITDQVQSRRALEESEKKARMMAEDLAYVNSELQNANKELGIANQRLTHTNVDLDNFIYTASHDLRAPISNIEGLLSILTDNISEDIKKEDDTDHILNLMQESVNRFKKTIDSLTDVVKLQNENGEEAVLVDLSTLIEEVSLDLEPVIKAAGAILEVDVDDCPQIRFSEKNLRSVIYNLLSNSIKYHSPERVPHIQISCVNVPGYHKLSVTDNGLGIEGPLDKLFTMFRRFHDHVEGTGIGLYMVKKMVENAGGHIHAKSEPGQGSTFEVYFPDNTFSGNA